MSSKLCRKNYGSLHRVLMFSKHANREPSERVAGLVIRARQGLLLAGTWETGGHEYRVLVSMVS